ncbi:MAG: POTRA domain-containing protein, partial [Fidelibacterota bacterium]
MRLLFRTVFFLAALLSLMRAQSVEPITLLGVKLEGNDMTSPGIIKYTSGLVEGKRIIPGDFGRSVKKLWDTGLFSDVQILLDQESAEGIYITIKVKENP